MKYKGENVGYPEKELISAREINRMTKKNRRIQKSESVRCLALLLGERKA